MSNGIQETGLCVWFSALLICVPVITVVDKRDETANNPDVSFFVKPGQLQKKLNDKNIRILDVRSQNRKRNCSSFSVKEE